MDGVLFDPISPFVRHNNWKGIMVEPVPFYFEQLKENFSELDGINFENVAITEKQEKKDKFEDNLILITLILGL